MLNGDKCYRKKKKQNGEGRIGRARIWGNFKCDKVGLKEKVTFQQTAHTGERICQSVFWGESVSGRSIREVLEEEAI